MSVTFRRQRLTRAARILFFAITLLGALLFLWLAVTLAQETVEGLFPWQQQRLQRLALAAAIWLLFLLGMALVAARKPSWLPQRQIPPWLIYLLLGASLVLFLAAYGWLGVARHQRFNSTGYDLAINEQIVWNTLHGRFFASSLEVDNSFADHFRPFLLAVAPFYTLFPSPLTLILLQAFVLTLGAVPLFLLAYQQFQSRMVALALAAVYLLYPSVGFVARFDFHIEAFAIPAFFAAFYAMSRERWGRASVWLLIPLLTKENMGLTVAAFGLYAIVMKRENRWGLGWILLGLSTFAVTSFWLIPTVRGSASDTLSRYQWLGDSVPAMIGTLLGDPGSVWDQVTTPDRLLYLLQLFLPVGFLALLGLPELLLAVPGLGLNLLATHHCQPSIYCQYTVPVTPFIFIAAVYGLWRLRRLLRDAPVWKVVSLPLVLLALVALWIDNPFTESEALPDALTPPGNADVVAMALATVPGDSSVVTTNDYAPHLAQRPELFIIGIPSQREAPTDPGVVFLNLYDQQYIVCDQYREYVMQLDSDRYGVIFRTAGLIVIQRDAGDPAPFRDFVDNWNNCAG